MPLLYLVKFQSVAMSFGTMALLHYDEQVCYVLSIYFHTKLDVFKC